MNSSGSVHINCKLTRESDEPTKIFDALYGVEQHFGSVFCFHVERAKCANANYLPEYFTLRFLRDIIWSRL